jgi:hypothetical protein
MKDKLFNLTYIIAVVILITGVCLALVTLASSGLAVPVDELFSTQASELRQAAREAL